MGKVIRGARRPFLIALSWVLVAGWAGFIWALLTLPGEQTPDVSFIPFGDKLGHAGLYFIWGLLVCWAAVGSFRLLSRLGVAAACVAAAALYGAVSEVYQARIGREADVLDIGADLLGAIAAQYIWFSPRVRTFLKSGIRRRVIPTRPSSPAFPPSDKLHLPNNVAPRAEPKQEK